MMLSIGTYAVILVPILILLGWLVYDVYFKTGQKVRIFLFEKVGSTKIYKGQFKGVEKRNKNLGTYLLCKKIGLRISFPSIENFFPGQKINSLFICKYASDDFRVMTLLKEDHYFKKVYDEETDTFVDEKYFDPIGITQTARESIRFERAFHNEMNEFLRDKPTFWDKYGSLMINGLIVILFIIFVVFLVRKNNDLQMDMTTKFAKVADEYVEEIKNPGFVDKMIEEFQRSEMEAATPIT